MAGFKEPIPFASVGTVKIGPFISDVDGKTPVIDLVIAQADVRLSKNNQDFAQKDDTGSAVHDENGWYDIPLNANDTTLVKPGMGATNGHILISIIKSGALPVWRKFVVDAPAP